MGSYAKERAAERITELAARGHDLVTFWRECTEALEAAIPHYDKPCWYTLDPASLLITSHYHDGLSQYPPSMLRHEYYGDDVNHISDVVRSEFGISTLHEATGGDPSSSPSWHLNMAMGGDQEMIAALRNGGAVWGAVGLYRAPGEPLFDADDKAFLLAVAPDLATGARAGLLVGEARDPQWPDSPGLVVLSEDGEVESTTPGIERWLRDLPDGDLDAGRLPSAVHAVAGRALRTAQSCDDPGEVALASVLSRSGTWIVLHGTSLVASGLRRAAAPPGACFRMTRERVLRRSQRMRGSHDRRQPSVDAAQAPGFDGAERERRRAPAERPKPQACGGGHHRRPAHVHGGDDLLRGDPFQVSEVVPRLAWPSLGALRVFRVWE